MSTPQGKYVPPFRRGTAQPAQEHASSPIKSEEERRNHQLREDTLARLSTIENLSKGMLARAPLDRHLAYIKAHSARQLDLVQIDAELFRDVIKLSNTFRAKQAEVLEVLRVRDRVEEVWWLLQKQIEVWSKDDDGELNDWAREFDKKLREAVSYGQEALRRREERERAVAKQVLERVPAGVERQAHSAQGADLEEQIPYDKDGEQLSAYMVSRQQATLQEASPYNVPLEQHRTLEAMLDRNPEHQKEKKKPTRRRSKQQEKASRGRRQTTGAPSESSDYHTAESLTNEYETAEEE
ncbi:hypothetical protein PMZ80_001196 [Knufia obscura]|uniref:Uncharacterized protein n=1 Tax=Knufia obscura TaxID=1635080 RepID=A0ABR0S2I5_9EURO|nr:hypothetical protein PMZ80_001196 [Knufia obscura]